MRPEIKVSISAKLEHAKKLHEMRYDGFHICSRWIALEAAGATDRLRPVTHWEQENFDDIAMGHFHLFYLEPGDHIKGGGFETGWACGRGKRIWIAGDGSGVDVPSGGTIIRAPHRDIFPWAHYRQQVRVVLDKAQAFKEMNALVNTMYSVHHEGGVVPPPNFFDL